MSVRKKVDETWVNGGENAAGDPWCHHPWCGWDFDRVAAFEAPDLLCPGCHARDNPHATGPHTRIVEEWEHEYGALCRVVVGPIVASEGWNVYTPSLEALSEWMEAPDVVVLVGQETASIGCDRERTTALIEAARSALHGPVVERLALEWSPPLDEEAA